MPSCKAPAFQLYAADFLVDENVVVMSLEERGAYITLMCYCWRENSLPPEIEKLARLCGCQKDAMEAIWQGIGHCFAFDKGLKRYRHPRLDAEREKQREFSYKKAQAGSLGGKQKHLRASTARDLLDSFQDIFVAKSSSSSSSSSSKEREVVSTSETGQLQEQPAELPLSPEGQKSIRNPSILDEKWDEFKQAFSKASVPATDEQWSEALYCWRVMDPDQRQTALAYIPKATEADFWKVTHASPHKYLRQRIWTLPIPEPKKAPQQADKAQPSRLPTADEILKQQEAHAREWMERHNTPEAIAKRAAEDAEIERRKAARMARQTQSGVIAHAS